MRRPTSSSIHSSYRPIFQSIGNADDQRDGSASLARRLSIRERNRRALNDNLIFNPMRRPRDRLYQELAERHRAARFVYRPVPMVDYLELERRRHRNRNLRERRNQFGVVFSYGILGFFD